MTTIDPDATPPVLADPPSTDPVLSGKVIVLHGLAGTMALVGYACAFCHEMMADLDRAAKCCTCADCGTRTGRYTSMCRPCLEKHARDTHAEHEARDCERLATAAKVVPEAEHAGWIEWSDGAAHNDGFFESADELRAWCVDEGRDPPARVWACESHSFGLNADHIIESELESGEYHEGAGGAIGAGDIKELQTLLDVWVRSVTVPETWTPIKTAVALDPTCWTDTLREAAEQRRRDVQNREQNRIAAMCGDDGSGGDGEEKF